MRRKLEYTGNAWIPAFAARTVNIKPPDWKLYQIIDFSRNQDTADIRPGDLINCHRADLIMEATDAAGELNYIAAAVSFTADARTPAGQYATLPI